jgi:hypothetical protein
MTQSEITLPIPTIKSYLSLKLSRAAKTGSRSQGYIHYRILKDIDQELLHIAIVANDGGGCYSKEIVAFEKIELCLQKIDLSKTIASKLFEQAFIGKSANNAGFMAAILRAEHLLMPSPSSMHQHAIQPDWTSWKTAMFALTNTAEHYQPEPPKPRIMQKSIKEPSHEDQQSNQQNSQDATIKTEANSDATDTITGAGDDTSHSEFEMDLLQQSALSSDVNDEDELDVESDDNTAILDMQQTKKLRTIRRPHASS